MSISNFSLTLIEVQDDTGGYLLRFSWRPSWLQFSVFDLHSPTISRNRPIQRAGIPLIHVTGSHYMFLRNRKSSLFVRGLLCISQTLRLRSLVNHSDDPKEVTPFWWVSVRLRQTVREQQATIPAFVLFSLLSFRGWSSWRRVSYEEQGGDAVWAEPPLREWGRGGAVCQAVSLSS